MPGASAEFRRSVMNEGAYLRGTEPIPELGHRSPTASAYYQSPTASAYFWVIAAIWGTCAPGRLIVHRSRCGLRSSHHGGQTLAQHQRTNWDEVVAHVTALEDPRSSLNRQRYSFTEIIDRPFCSGAYGAISCPAGHQLYEAR